MKIQFDFFFFSFVKDNLIMRGVQWSWVYWWEVGLVFRCAVSAVGIHIKVAGGYKFWFAFNIFLVFKVLQVVQFRCKLALMQLCGKLLHLN